MRINKVSLSLSLYFIAICIGSLLFVCSFTYGAHGTQGLQVVSYLLASATLSAFSLCFNSLYILLSQRHARAATPSIPGFISTHFALLALGYTWLLIFTECFNVSLQVAVQTCALLLAGCSLLAGRIWIFINPVEQAVEYEALPGEFYQDATNSSEVGSFRAWYHGGRYTELQSRVLRVYKEGDSVYDFGGGSTEWNSSKIPVIGVDVNRSLLETGMAKGHLAEILAAELYKTGLPDNCANIIIIAEVIEHMVKPRAVLAEIARCLKPGGTLILTVPWDTPFSPFFWLFNVQCFFRGYVLGEDYYQQRCGHVNHFSGRRLRILISSAGLCVETLHRFRGFLLYSVSRKQLSA